jgi:hypothetical protein
MVRRKSIQESSTRALRANQTAVPSHLVKLVQRTIDALARRSTTHSFQSPGTDVSHGQPCQVPPV